MNDHPIGLDYRVLFDGMLDGLAYCQMIFNAAGSPVDFIYIRVNKNFEALTGLKNIEGKRVTEAIPGIKESNPDIFDIYGRVSISGNPERFETYVPQLERWFLVSVYSPSSGYFVAIFQNITIQKQSEQIKNDFLSLASHQLRTPLSAMKWTLESLLEDASLTTEQIHQIQNLHDSNERLIELVNKLLNIHQLEAGKLVVHKQMTDIADVVRESIAMLQANADQKHQSIITKIDAKITATFVDPFLLREACKNLLSNAINYGPDDAEIVIRLTEKDNFYIVGVHNWGPYIPDGERQKLFTKFYRGVDAKTLKTEGNGLGLFMAKLSTESNGGMIWLESTPDKGTTFYFSVPIILANTSDPQIK